MATVKPRQGAVKVPPTMGGREAVAEPLEAPRPVPRSKAAIILPVVMGVAFLGIMALMLSQPGLRSGTMGMMSLFFPIMMIVSMGSYMFSNRGGGDKQLTGAQLEQARRDYAMNLDETREKVQDAARAQHAQFEYLHPQPALLSGLVGSARMWCRTPNDPVLKVFFSQVRIGLGTSKVVKELDTNELGRREDYEPVTYDASSAFLQTQSKLHNAPKPLLLRNIAGMALIGRDGMDPVYGLARAMICQAAVAHSPARLQDHDRDRRHRSLGVVQMAASLRASHTTRPRRPDADGVVNRGADGRRGRHGTARPRRLPYRCDHDTTLAGDRRSAPPRR